MKIKKGPFIKRPDLIPNMKGEFEGFKLKPYFRKAGRPEYIKSILVVDDDHAVLKMYTRFLSSFGFDVMAVNPLNSIPDQIGVVDSLMFEAIIMDGDLSHSDPNLTGMALILQLRNNGYKNYIFANSSDPELQRSMLAVGADWPIEDKSPLDLIDLFVK